MAYSAPLYMEVRWRLLGSDEAWSEPRRVSPVHEVVVEELDRTKQYEFEARNVSACGAKSDWVLVSHTVPDYSPDNIRLDDLKDEVADAASEAAQANADLARIASDNMLTIGEKPTVIRDYNVIVTEQAGIDAQAAAFSITTERTAYDAKVTALVNYINTLTSPTDWNDLTGETAVDGPTLRTVFAEVYTSRQTLLNKIYAAAKALADKAQKGVDDLAAEQYCYNPTFRIGTSGWTSVYNGAGFYTEAGNNSPDPSTATYLVREGQPSPFLVLMENTGGGLPVREGQGVTASIALRAIGTNGGARAYVRLEWLDTNRASIGSASEHTGICSLNTGDDYFVQGVSRVKGTAPAGACYAIVTIEYDGHTSGIFTATHAAIGYTAASADEIAEGASRKWAAESGAVRNYQSLGFRPDESGGNLVLNSTFPNNTGKWINELNDPNDGIAMGTGAGLNYLYCTQTATNNTGGNCNFYEDNWFPCDEGDVFFVTATLSTSASANDGEIGLNFDDGSGGGIQWEVAGVLTAGRVSTTVSGLVTAPSGARRARMWAAIIGPVNGDQIRLHNVRVERGSILKPGSGARLGDLRNQVMVGVGNYASGWSGGGITYSSTNTSATITMSAATLRAGSQSIAYSQASTTVSVSSSPTGSQHRYYLYLDDPDYSGGSKSLHATTSEATSFSSDGRVLVGNVLVAFPSSGSRSGVGEAPCPDENAWVMRADPNGIQPDWPVRAKEVKAGHFLRLTDGTAGLVTYSERKAAERVRVVSVDGYALTCSTSAPLELAGHPGKCVLAPDAQWELVLARFKGDPRWAALIEAVEDAGPGYVQHITCQNACFWTGDDPKYLFGHHNMKQMRDP